VKGWKKKGQGTARSRKARDNTSATYKKKMAEVSKDREEQ